mmetsp:Transcript_16536/g.31226  ORF Transcript_16536/g.31226 Transcript_16536/m.31226 type:complete len:133 (-) Transcript_16536:676-1074(-)
MGCSGSAARELPDTPVVGAKRRDRSAQDTLGENLIKFAKEGNLRGVKQQLRAGAPPNYRDGGGYTSLMHAAWIGRRDISRTLVEEGRAEVNASAKNGTTALMCAADNDHMATVRYLVDTARADVDVQNGVLQ